MPKRILHSLLILCSLFTCGFTKHTMHLPKHANVPGGIVILDLELDSNQPPTVYYNNQRTVVIADPKRPNNWLSIIGIPLDAPPGKHQANIMSNGQSVAKEFSIEAKAYPTQTLSIANKRKVEPLAEDLSIIETQYLETIQTYMHWQYHELKSLLLNLPVKGRKSSPFGFKRVMNNIEQNPHSGLDIAAARGSKVKAPKAGKVLNIGNYFYSGNIVFVDHGQGFITSYGHLDAILVNKGQELEAGDVIGTVGDTGRATAPHLHWSVSLNGVRVDPQLFIYE